MHATAHAATVPTLLAPLAAGRGRWRSGRLNVYLSVDVSLCNDQKLEGNILSKGSGESLLAAEFLAANK